MKISFNVWYMFVFAIIAYGLFNAISMIKLIVKKRALTSKKTTKFHKWLRSKFYLTSMYKIREYIHDYCSPRYRPSFSHRYSTVEAIIMYEIDLNYYRDLFINQGYDRLFIETLTKLEEINKFVFDWKKANDELTSSEMLELYLNETKPH